MAKKPSNKPGLEERKAEPGPIEDTKFQKVVQTFLKTPPRQHKEDVGRGQKPKRPESKS